MFSFYIQKQRKTPLSPQLSDLAVKDISHIFLALITLIEKKNHFHIIKIFARNRECPIHKPTPRASSFPRSCVNTSFLLQISPDPLIQIKNKIGPQDLLELSGPRQEVERFASASSPCEGRTRPLPPNGIHLTRICPFTWIFLSFTWR